LFSYLSYSSNSQFGGGGSRKLPGFALLPGVALERNSANPGSLRYCFPAVRRQTENCWSYSKIIVYWMIRRPLLRFCFTRMQIVRLFYKESFTDSKVSINRRAKSMKGRAAGWNDAQQTLIVLHLLVSLAKIRPLENIGLTSLLSKFSWDLDQVFKRCLLTF